MTDAPLSGIDQWYLRQLGGILYSLWQDRRPILAVTLAVAIAGGVVGKISNTVTSSAQLLLTPLPLRSATAEDPIAQMIPVPMEVRTAALLCMSDEAMEKTRQRLNDSAKFDKPILALQNLRDALNYQITIAKETPYETIYSPVIVLTARGKSPAEAKLTVDTWAEVCAELARTYKTKQLGPAVEAFQIQGSRLQQERGLAAQTLEAFRREKNIDYYDARVTALVSLIAQYLGDRAKAEQDLNEAKAKHDSMRTVEASQQPVLSLEWTPAAELANIFLPDGKQLSSPDTSDESTAGALLMQQVINPLYQLASSESALSEASHVGFQARFIELNKAIEQFLAEMTELQAERAAVLREEEELTLEVTLATEAYSNAAVKAEYARMAQDLDAAELQILSSGAEWRMPRFRRALLFAGFAGLVAFSSAAVAAIAMRRIILPALDMK